jgi:hypothetical protein
MLVNRGSYTDLVKVLDAALFYRAVYVLIFAVGLYLVWEGLTAGAA